MLDKEAAIRTVKQYSEVVVRELSPDAIIMFGSYIKGAAHNDSDIDVAVIFNGFTGDWRETVSRLWRLRRNVSYDIEPHLLDSADDKSGFVEHVYKTGQMIYKSTTEGCGKN